MKHKDGKGISKAKSKSATVKRSPHQSPINFRDRPRSLPLLEKRLKRELAAKLAARKAKQHLQTSRKRRQQEDILAPKPNADTVPPLVCSTATLCSKAPLAEQQPKLEEEEEEEEEDIYENSQPEGYYLIPMSQEDSPSEDSEPEAEYATIHHNNRVSGLNGMTPDSCCASPPPPPPPPPQLVSVCGSPPPPPPPSEQEDDKNPTATGDRNLYYQTPNAARLLGDDKENFAEEDLPATCAVLARQDGVEEDSDEEDEDLDDEEDSKQQGIYENDADLRLSVCKFAADGFGPVYENLDDRIPEDKSLQEEDAAVLSALPDIDRDEGAVDDHAKDGSSASMRSVRSSIVSETNTQSSVVMTDESMSAEEMEMSIDNMTENIIWAKGLKVWLI